MNRRLTQADVRRVFHLIGEIAELGRDPAQWRSHLLQQLSPIIGAKVAIVCEHYINPSDANDTRLTGLIEYGWKPDQQEKFYHHLNTGGMVRDPLHAVVQKLNFRSFTRRRRDFVSDEDWYGSPTVDPIRRECDVDDTLHSRCRLPQPGWAQAMTFMRNWGEKPFEPRDRLIVSLLHRELGRLWSQVDRGSLATLPPRLRQTLDMIFSGYSEKHIAQALNVSAHTAHDFCRRLYRHFGVSGRGGLVTNPDCRRLLFRPALSPAYYLHDRGIAEGTFPQQGVQAGQA